MERNACMEKCAVQMRRSFLIRQRFLDELTTRKIYAGGSPLLQHSLQHQPLVLVKVHKKIGLWRVRWFLRNGCGNGSQHVATVLEALGRFASTTKPDKKEGTENKGNLACPV